MKTHAPSPIARLAGLIAAAPSYPVRVSGAQAAADLADRGWTVVVDDPQTRARAVRDLTGLYASHYDPTLRAIVIVTHAHLRALLNLEPAVNPRPLPTYEDGCFCDEFTPGETPAEHQRNVHGHHGTPV